MQKAICAGGGDFDRILIGAPGCTIPFTDNSATVILDGHMSGGVAAPDCFYRKNFGLNGVVDARQCGVYGDGVHDDGADLNNCMLIAAGERPGAPPLQNLIHIVSTGGGVILDNTTSINIPDNMELTCSGTGTGTAQAHGVNGDNYRIGYITNAIVIDPTTDHSGPRYSVELNNNNSTFSGCNLIAGAGVWTGTAYPNPNSPSIWYPYCSGNATPATPCPETTDASIRSGLMEYNSFNPNLSHEHAALLAPAAGSIGIHLSVSENLTVRNVTVLGFQTCYQSDQAGSPAKAGTRLIIERLFGDCDTGISVDHSSDETHFNAFAITPFLTRSLGDGQSQQTLKIDALVQDGSSSRYAATVELNTGASAFYFKQNDTVWIATGSVAGTFAESAAGRWVVANDPGTPTSCHTSLLCQTLVLAGSNGEPDSFYSVSSPLVLTGTVNNVMADGVPPTAITGLDPSPSDPNLQLVAIGQKVSGSCIPANTTVTDVWPARGIVYMSQPATCSAVNTSLQFNDHPYFLFLASTCSPPGGNPDAGCYTVNSTERFGDGIVVTNSGGVTAVNCQVFEHMTAFHFSTNANSSRFANCNTGENVPLPDQDAVGLKIDGDHSTAMDAPGDSCGNEFVNGILGQHRTVGILVQSNCDTPNHLTNVRFSGHPGGRRNAIALELDAGTVALTNSDASGSDNVLKADQATLYDGSTHASPPATLSIGNNQFPNATLFMSNSEAAASTSGCGNTFSVPTPYLCAPSSFVSPAGGRLTLVQGLPVMSSDVTGATNVYYSAYASQQVPIYNTPSGVFGLDDIGSGLRLKLNTGIQLSGKIYDIFAVIDSGSVRLCSGPAWITVTGGSLTRDVSGQISLINGVWGNSVPMSCHIDNGTVVLDHSCLVYECTYLGSIYTTAAGQTSQQFGPIAASGGGGNCLCVYNAYNHVAVTSTSQDNGAAYSYTSTTWRSQRASSNNRITGIDGLGNMQLSAQLVDGMSNASGGTGYAAAAGVEYIFPGGTIIQPVPLIQAGSNNIGSYSTTATRPPIEGIWIAQAVEAVVSGSTGTPSFGGPGYQQLSVQVQD